MIVVARALLPASNDEFQPSLADSACQLLGILGLADSQNENAEKRNQTGKRNFADVLGRAIDATNLGA